MSSRRTFLVACAGVAASLPGVSALAGESAPAAAASEDDAPSEGSAPKDEGPVVFHVVMHTPGKAWKAGTGFREQPGVMAHVEYMAGLLEAGTLAFGGPFLDDSGGMALLQGADRAEAERIAMADPAVQAGLLNARVVPWMVAMSGKHG